MAFPVVASVTETGFSSGATSHAVAMPATVNAGDLLVILFSAFSSETITTPSGWTQLYDLPSVSFVQAFCCIKDAAGTEGGTTVDVVTGNSVAGSAHVYRITGWDGTLSAVEANTVTGGSGVNPNPPSHTPTGGAEDILWLVGNHTGDDDQATTAIPTNYTDEIDTACGAGANASGRVASARRELNASSEDPGTFTIASSEAWVATTISIPPGAAAVGPTLKHPIGYHLHNLTR